MEEEDDFPHHGHAHNGHTERGRGHAGHNHGVGGDGDSYSSATGHPLAIQRSTDDWYEIGSLVSRSNSTSRPHAHRPPHHSTALSAHVPPQRKPKTTWQKFKDALCAFLAWVFSNVGICVLVVGYLLVGAAVFEAIEGPGEVGVRFHVGEYRNATVARLWAITEEFNTLHRDNWTESIRAVVLEFENYIIEQKGEGYGGSDFPSPAWTFSGSLLYSITVITTIGKPVQCFKLLFTVHGYCGFLR